MSLRSNTCACRFVGNGLLALLAVGLISGLAVAQSDSTPKWDLFVGYHYMHPGENVPAPGGDPNNPTSFTLPDMNKGGGAAVTYNFDQHWGLEVDFGYMRGQSNSDTQASFGPRFMWRMEAANFFAHALIGGNFLSVQGLMGTRGTVGL